MKRINEGELFQHLGDFLKKKGIELKEGSYAKRVEQGCAVLSDAINLSQSGLEKAKTKAGEKLDELRRVIHEKTAPRSSNTPPTSPPPAPAPTAAGPVPKARPRKPVARSRSNRKRTG